MKKRAIVAVFLGICLLGVFAAYAQPPPVEAQYQQVADQAILVVSSQIVATTECPIVIVPPSTALPVGTKVFPVATAHLRPNGDGNLPGGDRDFVASLSPKLSVAHEDGIAQPVTALAQNKEVFRDVAVACLRPCCWPVKKDGIMITDIGGDTKKTTMGILVINLNTAHTEWE